MYVGSLPRSHSCILSIPQKFEKGNVSTTVMERACQGLVFSKGIPWDGLSNAIQALTLVAPEGHRGYGHLPD